MPTILRIGPYRFFFYASKRAEHMNLHVEAGDGTAKFWLDPVRLQVSQHGGEPEVGGAKTNRPVIHYMAAILTPAILLMGQLAGTERHPG